MRIGTTALLIALLSCGSAAENLEKTQKKALEAQAKAIVAEAKSLEAAGQLAEARVKYAASQALLETRDAADAIKHLDEEIHKRVKDALSESRKLYEAHKYKEAAIALEQGTKMGASQGVLSFNLALCYFQMGDRHQAVESLDATIRDTPDPKEKLKLQQLLTSFTTGENGAAASDIDKLRVVQFNQLADRLGFDASLEDEESAIGELFSGVEGPSSHLSEALLKTNTSTAAGSHSSAHHKSSMCIPLEDMKSGVVSTPSAIFDQRQLCRDQRTFRRGRSPAPTISGSRPPGARRRSSSAAHR